MLFIEQFIEFCSFIDFLFLKESRNQAFVEQKIVQRSYTDQMELAYEPVFSWLNVKDIKVFSFSHY